MTGCLNGARWPTSSGSCATLFVRGMRRDIPYAPTRLKTSGSTWEQEIGQGTGQRHQGLLEEYAQPPVVDWRHTAMDDLPELEHDTQSLTIRHSMLE